MTGHVYPEGMQAYVVVGTFEIQPVAVFWRGIEINHKMDKFNINLTIQVPLGQGDETIAEELPILHVNVLVC